MSSSLDPFKSTCGSSASINHSSPPESIPGVRSVTSRCKKQERLNEIEVNDNTMREAQFAFRSCDLKSWNSSSRRQNEEVETDSDPVVVQHWAIVIRFPGKKKTKTYIFEANDVEGKLEATRLVVDDSIFNESKYIGSYVTSPKQILDIAKDAHCLGKRYNAGMVLGKANNCQTFVKELLQKVHPDLLTKLFETSPLTILT